MVDFGEQKTTFQKPQFSHPDSTSEEDLVEFLTFTKEEITLTLDLSNLTQITTLNSYTKYDGVTYELTDTAEFPTDFDTNVVNCELDGGGNDMKITLTSTVIEGAIRTIDSELRRTNRQ